MITLLVATFVITVATGPDGKDYWKRRRASMDRPSARVIYLPSAACRGPETLK